MTVLEFLSLANLGALSVLCTLVVYYGQRILLLLEKKATRGPRKKAVAVSNLQPTPRRRYRAHAPSNDELYDREKFGEKD